MNREAIQTNWKQLKGDFQTKWTKLTTDDLDKAQGKFEALVGALQKHYGLAKDAAEKQLETFLAGIDPAKVSGGKDKDKAAASAPVVVPAVAGAPVVVPAVAGAPMVSPGAVSAGGNGTAPRTTA